MFLKCEPQAGDGFSRGFRKATLIAIRISEPPIMPFFKRAKILSTRLYEFFEGGNIDTIATSPDKLVRRTNQATFSDLRKSGIHKAFGEFVVHTRTVAPQVLASVLSRRVETAASRFHLFTFVLHFRHVRFTPESRHVRCTSSCPLWAINVSTHRALTFNAYRLGGPRTGLTRGTR